MKKQSKYVKQFIQAVQEYTDFNKFVAENKEQFLGKHYLFTRNKKHNFKFMIINHDSIFDYMIDKNFKYSCSCVRYWCNPLDSYWKNVCLTVSKINDDGLVQFEGRDDNEYSIHSLWVFEEVTKEFKDNFNLENELEYLVSQSLIHAKRFSQNGSLKELCKLIVHDIKTNSEYSITEDKVKEILKKLKGSK